LLSLLEQELTEHDFRLQFLIASIVSSKVYQRSSAATDGWQLDPALFARSLQRPMSAEQLWDSLVTATGDRTSGRPGSKVARANRNIQGLARDTGRGQFLITFLGVPVADSPQMPMTQAWKLMQGDFVLRMTDPESGPLLIGVTSAPFMSTNEQLETLFLA